MNASLWSGLAGAATVNLANETARRFLADAPRMDVVGKRALSKLVRSLGSSPPKGGALFASAMAGDVVSNASYYGLVARSENPLLRGLLLGALAGAGAVGLTPRLGLGHAPVKLTSRTAWLTFGWYLAGGLVAGLVARSMGPDEDEAGAETEAEEEAEAGAGM